MPSNPLSRSTLIPLTLAAFTACAEPPVQTGSDQVPETNIALAAAKDGKYNELTWPLVDDQMLQLNNSATAPGCAVGVAIDDEIVYLKGYGRSRLGGAPENWGVSTMGAVGSVSKTFTALAAVRQVENGWMDIEEPVDARLPIGGGLGNTTLFRLLSHTAGAGGNSAEAAFQPNWDAGSDMDACTDATTPDAGDPFCTEAHRRALDPVWLASNYAASEEDVFELERVNVDADPLNDGYEHYVWDAVGQWGPSWLTPGQATSMALIHAGRANDMPHRAVGYYDANWGVGAKNWTANDAWQSTPSRASWVGPAGGWALTIGDLTRLVIAYRKDRIVDETTRGWMESKIGYLDLGPDEYNLPPYGLGVLIDDGQGADNQRTVYHGGDIGLKKQGPKEQVGNSAHWSWWTNRLPGGAGLGIALMCNNGKASPSLYSAAKDIAEALEDDPESRPVHELGFVTAPSTSGVNGRTYWIDASRAYVEAPAGFPILPSAANPLVAQPSLTAGGQGSVAVRRATTGPNPGPTVGTIANASLDARGRLLAQGGNLQLSLGAFAIQARDVSMSFQVASDGSRLFDGHVQATVDARSLVSVGAARDVREVCTAVAAAKAACKPCLDGTKACFDVALGGLTAKR